MSTATAEPATWEPGVPLFVHPFASDDLEAQTVRRLFDVIPQHEDIAFVAAGFLLSCCTSCGVAWAPGSSSTCWVCGGPPS